MTGITGITRKRAQKIVDKQVADGRLVRYGDGTIIERDRLAQETAEYIAATRTPPVPETPTVGNSVIVGRHGSTVALDRRPPTAVAEIKATLLGGHVWISWMDDRVVAAMRALHDESA